MKVGNKIISIKDVYDPNGNILLIDEYEICTIYSIKPTIDLPLYISIYDKHNYTLTFSAIKEINIIYGIIL